VRGGRDHRYDVAFYIPAVGPLLARQRTAPAGGAENQVLLIARELVRRGLRICVIAFDVPGSSLPSSVDGIDVSVRPAYLARKRLGKLREVNGIRRAVFGCDAAVLVARVAAPDIGFVGLFAKLSRRRFVYSSANVSDFDLARIEPKRHNRLLFALGVRLADQIVVQTDEQALLSRERFNRSPVTIRSIAEPAPERRREPEALLWIGRAVFYKRPLAFIDLARSLPDARFWMVAVPSPNARGGPELMASLEREAAAVPNLELLPPRPREELMELIDRAVAVVNTADHEGMPNVFLEGWARGVPALALTHDPDGVIERHGLGAFAAGDSARFVELARDLWDTRGARADVASQCRRYVLEHHSPQAVAAAWQDALRIDGPRSATAEAAVTAG
jgi:glycosyltransferase involved in cell wall biosynthesis